MIKLYTSNWSLDAFEYVWIGIFGGYFYFQPFALTVFQGYPVDIFRDQEVDLSFGSPAAMYRDKAAGLLFGKDGAG